MYILAADLYAPAEDVIRITSHRLPGVAVLVRQPLTDTATPILPTSAVIPQYQ